MVREAGGGGGGGGDRIKPHGQNLFDLKFETIQIRGGKGLGRGGAHKKRTFLVSYGESCSSTIALRVTPIELQLTMNEEN